MAKNIDPFAKKETKDDLLKRVTAPPPAKKPQTPQSAKPLPAGVTGNPPLPTGRVVAGIAPSSLTPAERESLEAIGWTDDVPIPSNAAELIQNAQAERLAEAVPMPVSPQHKPIKVETVDIGSLDAGKRNALMASLADAFEAEKQQKEAEIEQRQRSAANMAAPGLADAQRAADVATARFTGEAEVVDDRQAPPESPKPAEASPTGANAGPSHCPHCSWDLGQPDVPEPEYSDKMAFLQCLIGQKPYVKAYPLLGGNVEVAFRTLTTREVDVVYKQAYADQSAGRINTEVDFWERVNRYRLFLQMASYKADGANGFSHDLPDGYSKSTNTDAQGVWVTEAREAELFDETLGSGTGVTAIEDWLISNVLKTEAVFRIVNNACNQFNRLVAKLEAMADNSDFWKPTGEQS